MSKAFPRSCATRTPSRTEVHFHVAPASSEHHESVMIDVVLVFHKKASSIQLSISDHYSTCNLPPALLNVDINRQGKGGRGDRIAVMTKGGGCEKQHDVDTTCGDCGEDKMEDVES
jgi:hypothetical protein